MVRLILAMLIAALASSPAVGQQRGNRDDWRITHQAGPEPSSRQIRTQSDIGRNTRFGLGIFGLRPERAAPPVTRRDIDAPRSRRVGVGLTVKF